MKKIIIVIIVVIVAVFSFRYFYINNYKSTLKGNIESVKKEIESRGFITPIDSYTKLEEKLNTNDILFLVIGRSNCSYCNNYLNTLNSVIKNYDLEILYIDITKLSEDDYYKLRHSELVIPGKCNDTNNDITIDQKFGTPMTLFINNKNTIDCIRGYKDYDYVSNVLNDIYK